MEHIADVRVSLSVTKSCQTFRKNLQESVFTNPKTCYILQTLHVEQTCKACWQKYYVIHQYLVLKDAKLVKLCEEQRPQSWNLLWTKNWK